MILNESKSITPALYNIMDIIICVKARKIIYNLIQISYSF